MCFVLELPAYILEVGLAVSVVIRLRAGRPGSDSRQGRTFPHHRVQTGSVAHPLSCPMGTGGGGGSFLPG
jgi:hypothetical protein